MDELAIFGGKPVRSKKIYYGKQYIDEADITAVEQVLRSDYLTCGPKIAELEERLQKMLQVKHAVAVSNGTAALHCACIAIGISEGDEVITTPMTFAATANCIRYCGGTVVFADINPETYNIDPDDIERKISSKTKAVIAVDYTGQAVEHDRIREICNRHHIFFIEDAAHAIGTKYNGRPIGSLADMTCFSFHPVKTVTSGEGGAITTNDKDLCRKLKLARAHGIEHEELMLEGISEGPWYYEMQNLGYNYRISDFQAALLLSQLEKLDIFSKKRKKIVDYYNEELSHIPELTIQREIAESDTTRHIYIIQLNLESLCCSRKEFFYALMAEGIVPQVHYIPVYYFPYYQKLGYKRGICPNAEKLYERIISIPLFPKMTMEDAQSVVKAIRKIIGYYRK